MMTVKHKKQLKLIKGKILETTEESVKDVANMISEGTNSEVVQVIGNKFILYKKNEKEPKIILPKVRRKWVYIMREVKNDRGI